MSRDDMSRRLSFNYPFLPDVDRRIDVTVMFYRAFRALPASFMQRHFRHLATTTMTLSGTRIPLIEFHHINAFLFRFVFQPADETMPDCIPNSTSKSVIFHHVCRFQRLHNDRLVFVNQCTGKLMLKIGSGVGYVFMAPGYL